MTKRYYNTYEMLDEITANYAIGDTFDTYYTHIPDIPEARALSDELVEALSDAMYKCVGRRPVGTLSVPVFYNVNKMQEYTVDDQYGGGTVEIKTTTATQTMIPPIYVHVYASVINYKTLLLCCEFRGLKHFSEGVTLTDIRLNAYISRAAVPCPDSIEAYDEDEGDHILFGTVESEPYYRYLVLDPAVMLKAEQSNHLYTLSTWREYAREDDDDDGDIPDWDLCDSCYHVYYSTPPGSPCKYADKFTVGFCYNGVPVELDGPYVESTIMPLCETLMHYNPLALLVMSEENSYANSHFFYQTYGWDFRQGYKSLSQYSDDPVFNAPLIRSLHAIADDPEWLAFPRI